MLLYELKGKYLNLLELVESDDISEEAFKDTLESMEYDLEEGVNEYTKIIKQLQAEQEIINLETERLRKKSKALDMKVNFLKVNLQQTLNLAGVKRVNTPLFKVYIQKNPPSVTIENGVEIPEEYYIPQDPKLDKEKLKEDIKKGIDIAGVSLKQSESLRIR